MTSEGGGSKIEDRMYKNILKLMIWTYIFKKSCVLRRVEKFALRNTAENI